MLKKDKERLVDELTGRLRSTQTLIVADYRGLTMSEIDALRGELLKHGARFSVVKNTLTRRAAEQAGTEALLSLLDGPTAIAFLESDGDPVAVAKALNDAARTTRVLAVKGGIMEGRTITADDVRSLATVPPVDVLRAQVLGAVAAPLYAIVGLFTAPLRDLVGLLDARIEQLGGAPEETAAAEPVAEPEASEPQGAAEPEPEAQPEAEAQPEPEAQREPEAQPEAEAQREPEAQPEAEAQPEVEAQAEAQPEPEAEAQTEASEENPKPETEEE